MKLIGNLNLDLSDLPATSEVRNFSISGNNGAIFTLEIKNEDSNYYNFVTKAFQAARTGLENKVIQNGIYRSSITFPTITDDDHYDISLFAGEGTAHLPYNEVRFGDGTIDINSSTGSNSALLKKIIYQYTDLTLTLSTFAPSAAFSITSQVNDTLTISRGRSRVKLPFSISCSSSSGASFTIVKQPTAADVLSFVEPTVGAAPEKLPGENEYPAVTSGDGDNVNGAVTSGVSVTMSGSVASYAKVGDRITGNAALNAATVTVASIDSTNVFSMSEAVALADGLTLSFSNRKNYQWPLNSIANIKEGMIVTPTTNITANTSIGRYQDTITLFPDTDKARIIVKNSAPALNTKAQKPTVVKGLVTVQPGNVVFDKQQVLALAGDALKIGGYGTDNILSIHGYDVQFSDLAIELTPVTTTTTAASTNSTSVVLAARDGILNSTSTVSGIGIDPSAAAPTVNSGANATGAGTVVLSAAQTLENGVTLTFDGAGKTATITGYIEVLKAGTADATLRFDVEKLLASA